MICTTYNKTICIRKYKTKYHIFLEDIQTHYFSQETKMVFVHKGTTDNNKKRAHHTNRQAPDKNPRSQITDSMQWYQKRKDSNQNKGPRKRKQQGTKQSTNKSPTSTKKRKAPTDNTTKQQNRQRKQHKNGNSSATKTLSNLPTEIVTTSTTRKNVDKGSVYTLKGRNENSSQLKKQCTLTAKSTSSTGISSISTRTTQSTTTDAENYQKRIDELQQQLKNKTLRLNSLLSQAHDHDSRRDYNTKIISEQFQWNVKHLVKRKIFPFVKFITDDVQLQSYTDSTSIGYFFIKQYKDMLVTNNVTLDNSWTEGELWAHAKGLLYRTITEKRNSVQTEIRKRWKGKQKKMCLIVSYLLLNTTICHIELYKAGKNDDKMQQMMVKSTFCFITLTTPSKSSENTDDYDLCCETFNLFLEQFGKCLAGVAVYGNEERANKRFSDKITISDEAFCIFTLERNWDVWASEVDTGNKQPMRSGDYTEKNTNKKYSGWTREGMDRYSELAKKIRKVRKTQGRKDLEDKFKIKAEKDLNSTFMRGSNMILDDAMMVTGKIMVPYNDINPVSSDDDSDIANQDDKDQNDGTIDDNESSDESDEDDDDDEDDNEDDNDEESRNKYNSKHDDFNENSDSDIGDVDESERRGQSGYYGEEDGDDGSLSGGDETHCTNTDSIDCNNEYGKYNVL